MYVYICIFIYIYLHIYIYVSCRLRKVDTFLQLTLPSRSHFLQVASEDSLGLLALTWLDRVFLS